MVDATDTLRSHIGRGGSSVGHVIGSCTHDIDVKVIPYTLARHGLELCVESARSLLSAAEILRRNDPTHAFFLVLTAYEELAKCSRIRIAEAVCHTTQNPLLVEDSLFSHHKTKYKLTMDYLDFSRRHVARNILP
jgi:hypothetical protein